MVNFRPVCIISLSSLMFWPKIRFWFFAARKNPDTAPLAIWLNGGVRRPNIYDHANWIANYHRQPGSSSMIGLFQENGPCRISNDSKTVNLNPNSWNTVANVYVCPTDLWISKLTERDAVVGCTLISPLVLASRTELPLWAHHNRRLPTFGRYSVCQQFGYASHR